MHRMKRRLSYSKVHWLFFAAVEQDPSWDIVKAVDLWEDDDLGDGYVLVKNDDATEGMAFFIATYISSLKTANVGTPYY